MAACADVGANAPKGGGVGSLAAARPDGSVDLVKKNPREELADAAACIAGFACCSNDAQVPGLLFSSLPLAPREIFHAAFVGAALRWRRKRPSSRRLPLRGMRSMSLTSLAPPLRRSSTILRL